MVAYQHALMIAWYGQGVLVTEDHGETWTRINDGLTNLRSSALSIIDGDLVLGVEGGVWRRALASVITGTTNPVLPLDFTAYPNPATDIISIQLNDDGVSGETRLTLFDSQGRIVKQMSAMPQEVIKMPTGNLAPGIYYLHGYHPGYSGWQKIVKQ